MNTELDRLLDTDVSWDWEPEINNSNGHEYGYWQYCGDVDFEQAAQELSDLRQLLSERDRALAEARKVIGVAKEELNAANVGTFSYALQEARDWLAKYGDRPEHTHKDDAYYKHCRACNPIYGGE